jgi:hypothetical protein
MSDLRGGRPNAITVSLKVAHRSVSLQRQLVIRPRRLGVSLPIGEAACGVERSCPNLLWCTVECSRLKGSLQHFDD